MELKTARLTLLLDPNKKAAFERLCAQQDRTASQVVRQLIRNYLAEHGASFIASGAPDIDDEPPPARHKPGPKPQAGAPAKPGTTGRRKA